MKMKMKKRRPWCRYHPRPPFLFYSSSPCNSEVTKSWSPHVPPPARAVRCDTAVLRSQCPQLAGLTRTVPHVSVPQEPLSLGREVGDTEQWLLELEQGEPGPIVVSPCLGTLGAGAGRDRDNGMVMCRGAEPGAVPSPGWLCGGLVGVTAGTPHHRRP